jgi:hypothetical protein
MMSSLLTALSVLAAIAFHRDDGRGTGRGARRLPQAVAMSGERLEVSVTFDPANATVPDLPEPVTALSLAMLRKRVEAALMPEDPEVRLMLDRKARFERDQRHRGGEGSQQWRAARVIGGGKRAYFSPTNNLTSDRTAESVIGKTCPRCLNCLQRQLLFPLNTSLQSCSIEDFLDNPSASRIYGSFSSEPMRAINGTFGAIFVNPLDR